MRKANLPGVETLIFSTHGESMGRGAHPGPLRRRLRYVFSGEARWRFFRHALPVKHETSFQGGDGYLFFGNRALATRALATIIMSGKDPGEGEDPFYTDINLSLDFQLRLRAYQQHLFAHPGYRALLGAFGANLLFKTGSRPVKRQGEHTLPTAAIPPACAPSRTTPSCSSSATSRTWSPALAPPSARSASVSSSWPKRSPRLRIL